MSKKVSSALISVFYKDGLEPVVRELQEQGIQIYSTGGTQNFIQNLGVGVTPVEELTTYPSILGGRVKTLHPGVFGGILARRDNPTDLEEMQQFAIPVIDLVIVDLYPFQETVANTSEESQIIEKIDIGGPSMIRAAAKNFKDVAVIASKDDYNLLVNLLHEQQGALTLEQRKSMAAKAFEVVAGYDLAIHEYFSPVALKNPSPANNKALRYGENPHQQASFEGNIEAVFSQVHGKEISYNNLVDIDAAIDIISELSAPAFGIIKHTNVCGLAAADNVVESWKLALQGDPESAFGGVLITNQTVNLDAASAINEIFFEVLIAPSFDPDALTLLQQKKNRILLQSKSFHFPSTQYKAVLNGKLTQDRDKGNYSEWNEVGGRQTSASEKKDLQFANIACKHLKSNAIALVKDQQLIGKGCGQTSRIDALRQALEKAKQSGFSTEGAVLASDAFFPFNDCVVMAHEAGIRAFIQPGGSIRDKDSITYCVENKLAMVITGMRHFRH